jgi:hypothetical protein
MRAGLSGLNAAAYQVAAMIETNTSLRRLHLIGDGSPNGAPASHVPDFPLLPVPARFAPCVRLRLLRALTFRVSFRNTETPPLSSPCFAQSVLGMNGTTIAVVLLFLFVQDSMRSRSRSPSTRPLPTLACSASAIARSN